MNFGGFEPPPPLRDSLWLRAACAGSRGGRIFPAENSGGIPGNGPEMAILGSRARIWSIADVENGIISSSAAGVGASLVVSAALLRDREDANRPARWSHGVIRMLRNGFERLQVSNLRNHETPQERARSRRGKARGDAILNVRKHGKRRQPLRKTF